MQAHCLGPSTYAAEMSGSLWCEGTPALLHQITADLSVWVILGRRGGYPPLVHRLPAYV